jgi:hypothetical protein
LKKIHARRHAGAGTTDQENEMTETQEEARLMIELSRWGTDVGLEEALAALFMPSNEKESLDDGDPNVRKVLWFFEFVGALVKRNAISLDFVRDVWWIDGIWPLVKDHVFEARKESGEASLYEHFEAMVG